MKRQTTSLTKKEYDVLIVGGGIFGAFAAWDAALRGLRVALVEKGDFAQATSSNHFKVVHGGIRYLQHLDVARVRESSRERSTLLRMAPHLVYPLPIIVPTYGHGKRGRAVLRAGCSLYDLLTADRNRRIADPARRIPPCRFLSDEEVLEHFPHLSRQGLTGGAVFCDGQIYNPPRLVISAIRSAVEAGADAANYVETVGLLREGDRIVGARALDLEDRKQLVIRARVVLNATGAWAPELLRTWLDLDLGRDAPSFSRDVAFVARRQLSASHGLAQPIGSSDAEAVLDRGGRHLLLLPWRGCTLVGVWHGVHTGPTEKPYVESSELERFLREANSVYPGLRLGPEDVGLVCAGLVLFGRRDQSAHHHHFGKRSLMIDHEARDRIKALVTLVGVRATVARSAAEKAIDLVARKLGQQEGTSTTVEAHLAGGEIDDWAAFYKSVEAEHTVLGDARIGRAFLSNYGSLSEDVLATSRDDPRLADPVTGSSVLKAELLYGVREEMARTLADVVLRRTELGTAGFPGEAALTECAHLVAQEMDWTKDRVLAEVEEVKSLFARRAMLRESVATNTRAVSTV